MKKLIIATNNSAKAKEIKAMLGDSYDEVLSLKDAGICCEVIEDGGSFYENARKKAVEISKIVEGDVLADDSGLCVAALNGAPGIYSARFAGENAEDEENNRKLLSLLQDKEDRSAKFVCAMVLANAGEEKFYTEGSVEGVILESPHGKNGFGYDPLFYYPAFEATFAQIPDERKNEVSHRSRALHAMCEKIKEN